MKPHYWLTLLALLPLTLSAAPPKVNFKVAATDFTQEPWKVHRCKYDDILKMRSGENPSDPDVPSLVLSKKTARDPDSHDFCKNIFTNLTKLDDQKVLDEIAAILMEIPCEPDGEWVIRFGSTLRSDADQKYPGIKHKQVLNRIDLSGCLSEMPAFCSLPPKTTSWDSGSLIVDHEKMMNTFIYCAEEIVKKVKEEGLEKKWEAEKAAKELQEKKEEPGARVVPTEEKKR